MIKDYIKEKVLKFDESLLKITENEPLTLLEFQKKMIIRKVDEKKQNLTIFLILMTWIIYFPILLTITLFFMFFNYPINIFLFLLGNAFLILVSFNIIYISFNSKPYLIFINSSIAFLFDLLFLVTKFGNFNLNFTWYGLIFIIIPFIYFISNKNYPEEISGLFEKDLISQYALLDKSILTILKEKTINFQLYLESLKYKVNFDQLQINFDDIIKNDSEFNWIEIQKKYYLSLGMKLGNYFSFQEYLDILLPFLIEKGKQNYNLIEDFNLFDISYYTIVVKEIINKYFEIEQSIDYIKIDKDDLISINFNINDLNSLDNAISDYITTFKKFMRAFHLTINSELVKKYFFLKIKEISSISSSFENLILDYPKFLLINYEVSIEYLIILSNYNIQLFRQVVLGIWKDKDSWLKEFLLEYKIDNALIRREILFEILEDLLKIKDKDLNFYLKQYEYIVNFLKEFNFNDLQFIGIKNKEEKFPNNHEKNDYMEINKYLKNRFNLKSDYILNYIREIDKPLNIRLFGLENIEVNSNEKLIIFTYFNKQVMLNNLNIDLEKIYLELISAKKLKLLNDQLTNINNKIVELSKIIYEENISINDRYDSKLIIQFVLNYIQKNEVNSFLFYLKNEEENEIWFLNQNEKKDFFISLYSNLYINSLISEKYEKFTIYFFEWLVKTELKDLKYTIDIKFLLDFVKNFKNSKYDNNYLLTVFVNIKEFIVNINMYLPNLEITINEKFKFLLSDKNTLSNSLTEDEIKEIFNQAFPILKTHLNVDTEFLNVIFDDLNLKKIISKLHDFYTNYIDNMNNKFFVESPEIYEKNSITEFIKAFKRDIPFELFLVFWIDISNIPNYFKESGVIKLVIDEINKFGILKIQNSDYKFILILKIFWESNYSDIFRDKLEFEENSDRFLITYFTKKFEANETEKYWKYFSDLFSAIELYFNLTSEKVQINYNLLDQTFIFDSTDKIFWEICFILSQPKKNSEIINLYYSFLMDGKNRNNDSLKSIINDDHLNKRDLLLLFILKYFKLRRRTKILRNELNQFMEPHFPIFANLDNFSALLKLKNELINYTVSFNSSNEDFKYENFLEMLQNFNPEFIFTSENPKILFVTYYFIKDINKRLESYRTLYLMYDTGPNLLLKELSKMDNDLFIEVLENLSINLENDLLSNKNVFELIKNILKEIPMVDRVLLDQTLKKIRNILDLIIDFLKFCPEHAIKIKKLDEKILLKAITQNYSNVNFEWEIIQDIFLIILNPKYSYFWFDLYPFLVLGVFSLRYPGYLSNKIMTFIKKNAKTEISIIIIYHIFNEYRQLSKFALTPHKFKADFEDALKRYNKNEKVLLEVINEFKFDFLSESWPNERIRALTRQEKKYEEELLENEYLINKEINSKAIVRSDPIVNFPKIYNSNLEIYRDAIQSMSLSNEDLLKAISKEKFNYYAIAWGRMSKQEDQDENFHKWLGNWVDGNSDLMGEYVLTIANNFRVGKIPDFIGGFEGWKKKVDERIKDDFALANFSEPKLFFIRWDPSRYTAHIIVDLVKEESFSESKFLKKLHLLPMSEKNVTKTDQFIKNVLIKSLKMDISFKTLRESKILIRNIYEEDQFKKLSNYFRLQLNDVEFDLYKNSIQRYLKNWDESKFQNESFLEIFLSKKYSFREISDEFYSIFIYNSKKQSFNEKIVKLLFNFGKTISELYDIS